MKNIYIFFILIGLVVYCLAEKRSDGSDLGLDFNLDEQSFINSNSAPINSEPTLNNEDQEQFPSDIEQSEPSLYDQFVGNEEEIQDQQKQEENLNMESIKSPEEILKSLENDSDLLGFTNKAIKKKGIKAKALKKTSKKNLMKAYRIKPLTAKKQKKQSKQQWVKNTKQNQNKHQKFINKRKLHKSMKPISKTGFDLIKTHHRIKTRQKQKKVSGQLKQLLAANNKYNQQKHQQQLIHKRKISNRNKSNRSRSNRNRINRSNRNRNNLSKYNNKIKKETQIKKRSFETKKKMKTEHITINQAFHKTFFHESGNQFAINNVKHKSVNTNYGSVDFTENTDAGGFLMIQKRLGTKGQQTNL